jgi:UDP-3-O-[3-hydroxymyristoyl] glucosamine N-acyltransferase
MRLREIAEAVSGRITGDGEAEITGFNSLADAGPADVSFLANPKYIPFLATTRAAAVLVPDMPVPAGVVIRAGLHLVRVANPDLAFTQVVAAFAPRPVPPPPGIHPSAVVAGDVRVGAGVAIGPCAVVGDGAVIGDGTVIYPNVTIGAAAVIGAACTLYPQSSVRERCRLGDRVVLHNGAVIGSDGFGYTTVDGVHQKIPQVGIVVVEDDVEIGANATIDRARFGRTRIGRGTKIDNLVQIAHNVEVGEHCIIVSQVGIAGSTRLGNHVTLAGQAGITGHIVIGDKAVVTAQSGVSKAVAPGSVVRGSPAQEIKVNQAQEVAARRLPAALAVIKDLQARVAELERRLGGNPS